MIKKLFLLALMGLAVQAKANTVDIQSGSGGGNPYGTRQKVPNPAHLSSIMTRDFNGNADIDAKWSVPLLARAEFSTTLTTAAFKVTNSTTVYGGMGIVDRLCVSSGAAGDYAVLYDTTIAAAQGGSIGALLGVTESAATQGIAIASKVTNPWASATLNGECFTYTPGVPFTNGLYILNSSSKIRTLVTYRLFQQ